MRSKTPNLTIQVKTRVAQFLLENSENGRLVKGKINEVASLFNISRRSVGSIWTATKKKIAEGEAVIFSKTKWKSHEDKFQMDVEKLTSLPVRKRCTIRRIAKNMDVSKSLVATWIKRGDIRPHTNAIKPTLTDENKLLRLKFCLSSLQYDRALNTIKFKAMKNIVHIDEKWFYMTQETAKCYLARDEDDPYRACKSKRYITKLMFMCAVSRPQYASNGDLIFDGKIGLFPFIRKEPAKRNSKNRRKGTLETKAIEAINKDVIKECIINKILPAIKEKWPAICSKEIFIQQDNARPHIKNNDVDFRAAASSDGFNIQLVCQPANSSDTNINDLGFFRAIQSLQVDTAAYNMDELVNSVNIAYGQLTPITLNSVFLSLQNCMIETMKCKGHNNYKIPHMNKERLLREGTLPDCLQVDELLVKECIDYIRQPGNDSVCAYDVESLVQEIGWLA